MYLLIRGTVGLSMRRCAVVRVVVMGVRNGNSVLEQSVCPLSRGLRSLDVQRRLLRVVDTEQVAE